jgi:hypothetical protein
MIRERLDPLITQEDRDFLDVHFTEIAQWMVARRLWRNGWRVEVDGCVYKLKVEGYPKKGTAIYEEQKAEIAEAGAAFEKEHGPTSEVLTKSLRILMGSKE